MTLYVTYRTVTAGADGTPIFRDDVYGRDNRVVQGDGQALRRGQARGRDQRFFSRSFFQYSSRFTISRSKPRSTGW